MDRDESEYRYYRGKGYIGYNNGHYPANKDRSTYFYRSQNQNGNLDKNREFRVKQQPYFDKNNRNGHYNGYHYNGSELRFYDQPYYQDGGRYYGKGNGNGVLNDGNMRGFAGRGAQTPHYRANDSENGNRGERRSWDGTRPGDRETQPSYANYPSREFGQWTKFGPFPKTYSGPKDGFEGQKSKNFPIQPRNSGEQGGDSGISKSERGRRALLGRNKQFHQDHHQDWTLAVNKDNPSAHTDEKVNSKDREGGSSTLSASDRENFWDQISSELEISDGEFESDKRSDARRWVKPPQGRLEQNVEFMADEKSGELGHKGYFTVGSHINCRYQGGEVEGEVAAFQNSSRLLVIRTPATNGKSSANDIYVINADCVDKIRIHGPTSTDNLKPIDYHKLEKRRQKSIGLKKARIRALSADVAPEGRKLFLAITKTIDEVAWEGEKIVVLNEVKISPPYKVEDVQGDKEASVVHVKKIVDKHWKENPATN